MDFPITATLDSVDRVNEKMQSLEITEQLTGSKADFEKFKDAIVLYPAYFDARKSEKQGRRVPRDLAINTDVTKGGIPLTAWQLAMACGRLDMHVLVEERKRYPRDYWGYGRIRVKPKGSSVMKSNSLFQICFTCRASVAKRNCQNLAYHSNGGFTEFGSQGEREWC
jgi:signal recognition particle subunit SEC65